MALVRHDNGAAQHWRDSATAYIAGFQTIPTHRPRGKRLAALPAVRALLTDPALDLGLPPKDVSRGIDNGFARADPFVASAAELFGGTVVRVLHPEPERGEK